MAVNTMIHTRKVRQKEKAEQAQQDVIKRANDYAKKRRGIVADGSPARQIEVLIQYIDGLEIIRDEMLEDFGYLPGIKDATKRVDIEIKQVLKEITLTKIQSIKPGQ